MNSMNAPASLLRRVKLNLRMNTDPRQRRGAPLSWPVMRVVGRQKGRHADYRQELLRREPSITNSWLCASVSRIAGACGSGVGGGAPRNRRAAPSRHKASVVNPLPAPAWRPPDR